MTLRELNRTLLLRQLLLERRRVRVNKKNATTKNTFTVDGFVAGAWRMKGRQLVVEPFAPLPMRARREVDAEGARLLAWYLAD